MDWQQTKEVAGVIAAVFGAVVAVLSFLKNGRELIASGAKGLWKLFVVATTPAHGPWTVTRKIDQVLSRSAERDNEIRKIKDDVKGIKEEMNPNGWDSMKDVLTLLLGNFKQSVKDKAYPIFVCDGDGKIIVVSRAFSAMVGIPTAEGLMDFDWKRWLYQEDREPFCRAFAGSAETRSAFRGSGRWVNFDSESIGRWEVNADVMNDRRSSRLLYRAILKPVDGTARDWCRKLGFQYDLL